MFGLKSPQRLWAGSINVVSLNKAVLVRVLVSLPTETFVLIGHQQSCISMKSFYCRQVNKKPVCYQA